MLRRGFLSFLGLGSGAAVSGISPGALAGSAGFAFPPRPNYPMGGVAHASTDPAWTPPEVIAQDALDWLTAHGLPDYVRSRLRHEAAQQAAEAHSFPPEIDGLRAFSVPAKRRLYAEQLVRRRERELLEGNRANMRREIDGKSIPAAIRGYLFGGF